MLLEDLGIGGHSHNHIGHIHDEYDSRSWREADVREVDPDAERRRRESRAVKNQSFKRQRAFVATPTPNYDNREVHLDHDHRHSHDYDEHGGGHEDHGKVIIQYC